ncbi:MAG: hypothetical protein F4X99_03500 [Gammaproteobacteria bacterium]|nr:hypothetical protein [Gammaproteobacteria bacterium]
MTGRRIAIGVSVLALLSAGAGLSLLAARTWPFDSWAILVFALWIAFPAWLFHATAPSAAPRAALGKAFAVLAPLALVGGAAALGHAVWRQQDAPLPMAFIAVPALQLAVVMPFLLFTGTDKAAAQSVQES